MQISTNLMFEKAISQMADTQNRLTQTQLKLSSSKEILKPSDAPDKSAVITRLNSAITHQNSYVQTIKDTTDKLTQQETALKSSSDLLVRLKELAVQGANDTLSAQDRKEIGIEAAGLRDQLRSMANTQDVNGNYIFSGSRVATAATDINKNGNSPYQGDQTINSVGISDQRNIDANRSATQAFSRIIRTDAAGNKQSVSFFSLIDDFVNGLQTNNTAAIQRSVGELDTAQHGLTENIANIGSTLNVLSAQQSVADENLLRMKSTLSDVQDVDYTQAITQMNKDMLALQAAQSSFSKISQLNLFEYLR